MADDVKQPTPELTDTEGALAIRVPADLDPRSKKGAVWVSTIPVTIEDKGRLINALGGSLPKLSECINETLMVHDIGRQTVELTQQITGEVFKGVRTILFADNNQVFATVSEGVSGSLALIFSIYGPPPWKPSLPLKIRQIDVGNNRRLYQLAVDVDALSKGRYKK